MDVGPDTLKDLSPQVRELRRAIPEVWKAHADLHAYALADGVLPAKVKELIALAISVVRECDGCIASHARGALRQQASRQEVAEALGVAVLMNGEPATVYAPRALAAFDAFAAATHA